MYLQVFLGFLQFYYINAFPLTQFYGNEGDTVNGQEIFYHNQPQSYYYYPNEINKPVFETQLGMNPQYYELVYNYVKDFAGTEPPVSVSTVQTNLFSNENGFNYQENYSKPAQSFGTENADKVASESYLEPSTPNQETIHEVTDKPGLNEYFLPSDYLTLSSQSNGQLYKPLDNIKTKRINMNSHSTSLPPLGGVLSNYVLLRGHSNPKTLLQLPGKESDGNLQHIKRQTPDNSDGVVILAEPSQNPKTSDENEQPKEEEMKDEKEEEQQMETNPGIAQSKPSAIALVGPGGVAQASPVGTALVGQGGLAVAAPTGTAVAGPAGQGALPIQIGGEKQKTSEKSEQSDFY